MPVVVTVGCSGPATLGSTPGQIVPLIVEELEGSLLIEIIGRYRRQRQGLRQLRGHWPDRTPPLSIQALRGIHRPRLASHRPEIGEPPLALSREMPTPD